LFWIVFAWFDYAEARISAHLILGITGIPSSLASFYLRHASMQAIISAAVLGWVQWVLLVAWWSTDEPEEKEG
jgi:hypothetical protein